MHKPNTLTITGLAEFLADRITEEAVLEEGDGDALTGLRKIAIATINGIADGSGAKVIVSAEDLAFELGYHLGFSDDELLRCEEGVIEAIDRLRTERGLSVSALAASSGLERSLVSRLLRGERPMYLHQAETLAKALGCRVVLHQKT